MSASRAITQAQRTGMRIVALPLTSSSSSTGRHIYYHFQTPPRIVDPNAQAKQSSARKWVESAVGKATDTWLGFGKAAEGTWKRRLYTYGERVVDRIDFQELALKSMDPSLGSKISNFGPSALRSKDQNRVPQVPLIHPTNHARTASPLTPLQELVRQRTPTHRKCFYLWVAVTPVTFPLKLIPIIPNIPFFFCVWRSWHHYRAYKASSYLESLLHQRAILPEPNAGLDKIYEECRRRLNLPSTSPALSSSESLKANQDTSTTTAAISSSSEPERLILDREAVSYIISHFELPQSAEVDLYRALEQTSKKLLER